MATMVCQGLQTCLDSPLEPWTLRLKLSSSILPHFSQSLEFLPQTFKPIFPDTKTSELPTEKRHSKDDKEQTTSEYNNNGGWSFLQSLPNSSSQSSKLDMEKTTYVHPLVKRSKSALSEKSLQLCTENLGNETGSDMIDGGDAGILSNTWRLIESSSEEQKRCQDVTSEKEVKKAVKASSPGRTRSNNFPPPLTTMSGKEAIQVRPHREDGRLVIKAVKGPSRLSSCFHAERSEGRLRLCLLEDYYAPPTFDPFEEKSLGSEKEGCENDIKEENDINKGVEERGGEVEVEEKEKDEEEMGEKEKGKMGIRENFEFERGSGSGSSGSVRRCKEGGEVLQYHEKKTSSMLIMNWPEPLWVATS